MRSDKRHTLAETDAWRVALAWKDLLYGHVRLELDLHDPQSSRVALGRHTLVDRFEWVAFLCTDEKARVTTAARASTIVWYALTCCPGFSGTENPDFWRRVFTDLISPTSTYRPQVPITEAVRFFDNPHQPFPRVRLVPQKDLAEQCVRGFLRGPVDESLVDQTQLGRILHSLEPFVHHARWTRVVPVAIDGVAASTLAQFLPTLKVRCTPNAQGALLPPHFRLEAINLQGSDLASLDAVQRLVVHSRATMIIRQCDTTDLSALVNAPEAIQAQLRRRLCVHTVDLVRPTESASCFAGVCAAIPNSEWISGCRIFSFGETHPKEYKSYRANIAWLAYAIFHPDTSTGIVPFTDLDIVSPRFPSDLLRIFKMMSKGNNLVEAINGDRKSPSSGGYYSGRIHASTVARTKPTRFSHSVHTFCADKWMTICTNTTNIAQMPAWVPIVLPGIGLAYIPRKAILSVTKRPPAAPCVRRLRLAIGVDPHLAFMTLLYRFGTYLEFLDMTDIAFSSSIVLGTILMLCPKLKSLRTAFAPGPRHDDGLADLPHTPCTLEELELTIASDLAQPLALDPLLSPVFGNLYALRIVTRVFKSFTPNRESFFSILAAIPTLQYAHWHENLANIRPSFHVHSYQDRQRQSRKLLGDISDWEPSIFNGPNPSQARVAFLSVVYHDASQPSIVGQLGTDVLRNIISFVPKTLAREVCVSDSWKLRRTSRTALPS